MTLIPILRILKLLAVMLLATGTIGATLRLPLAARRTFAYKLAGPGFGFTWTLGFVYAALADVPLTRPFIVLSMALSLFSVNVVLYLAGREERGSALATAAAILPLVLCVVLMVLRPG